MHPIHQIILNAVETNARLPQNYRGYVEQLLQMGRITQNEAGRVIGLGPIPAHRYQPHSR